MRDPVDELASFDPGDDMNPLPPSEIRRRGDRLRRRNTLLVAAGAAVAVVLVATPLAVLGAQRADDAPDPAPSPTPTEDARVWPTRIPDVFPLTSGMPDGTEEGQEFEGPGRDLPSMSDTGVELHACVASPAPGVPAADRLTARITGPADGHARELQVFENDVAAIVWFTRLWRHYGSCPEDDQDGGPPFVSTSIRKGAIGEESLDIRRTFDGGAGRVAITVVRVGNAVLVENISDEGADVDSLAVAARENLADVVAAMNELLQGTTEPPEPEQTDTDPENDQLDAADLLTADQVPAAYALTPYEQLPPYDGATVACQAAWLGDLGAEDLVSREFGAYGDATDDQTVPSAQVNTAVLQFADADAARAAYDTVKGWVLECEPRVDDRWLEAESTGGGGGERELGAASRAQWVKATFCGDSCEGVWFARMGYAQIGDRLVLVQIQEAGAPGSPEPKIWGLDEAIEALLSAAIERAAP